MCKKILLAIVAFLMATPVYAQCTGQPPAGTVCGNPTAAPTMPVFTGTPVLAGTTAPASAAGNTAIMGTLGSIPTLTNNGQAFLYNQTVNGAMLQGQGSTNDLILLNKSGTGICLISTGALIFNCNLMYVSGSGLNAQTIGGTVTAIGGTSTTPTFGANGAGAVFNQVANGLVLQGQGSASDIVLFNKNGSAALSVPTGTQNVAVANAFLAGNSILSSSASGGIGYTTSNGAGGAVTQGTSRTTTVTLNTITGAITLFTAAPTVGTWVSFGINDSSVAATDVVTVAVKSATNTYVANVCGVTNGTFSICFESVSGNASDTPVINFAIIKGSAN